MKIKDIRNIVIDKIVDNNIGRNVISTATGKDIDLLTRTSLIAEGVEYKPIFDEKGLRIPVTVAQPSTDPNYGIHINVYYQLIPKNLIKSMIIEYFPELFEKESKSNNETKEKGIQ